MARPGKAIPLIYQLTLFCILAYTISWSAKFLMVAPDAGLFNHAIPKGLLQLFSQFGPSIAGVIMIYIAAGKEGISALIRNFSRSNIHFKWYLFAVFFELILFLFVVIISRSMGDLTIRTGVMTWIASLKNFFVNLIVLTLLTGLGEEIGWRGFLLPGLQSRFPVIFSALVLALFNSLWHLRTGDIEILLTGDFQDFWKSYLPDMGLRILISTPVIFVIVYLFNKTKGSLVIMVLFHGASNASYEWVKEITGVKDPSFTLPVFAGLLWLTSAFFILALIKQSKNKELVTSL